MDRGRRLAGRDREADPAHEGLDRGALPGHEARDHRVQLGQRRRREQRARPGRGPGHLRPRRASISPRAGWRPPTTRASRTRSCSTSTTTASAARWRATPSARPRATSTRWAPTRSATGTPSTCCSSTSTRPRARSAWRWRAGLTQTAALFGFDGANRLRAMGSATPAGGGLNLTLAARSATLAVVTLGTPTPPVPTRFYTLTPCRVLDTRTGSGPALAAGAERVVTLGGGPCGVPTSAKAVSANLTVTQPTTAGNLVLFPTGTTPGHLDPQLRWPARPAATTPSCRLSNAGRGVDPLQPGERLGPRDPRRERLLPVAACRARPSAAACPQISHDPPSPGGEPRRRPRD